MMNNLYHKTLRSLLSTFLIAPLHIYASSNMHTLDDLHKRDRAQQNNGLSTLWADRDQEKRAYHQQLLKEANYVEKKKQLTKLKTQVARGKRLDKMDQASQINKEALNKLIQNTQTLENEFTQLTQHITQQLEQKYPNAGMEGWFADWRKEQEQRDARINQELAADREKYLEKQKERDARINQELAADREKHLKQQEEMDRRIEEHNQKINAQIEATAQQRKKEREAYWEKQRKKAEKRAQKEEAAQKRLAAEQAQRNQLYQEEELQALAHDNDSWSNYLAERSLAVGSTIGATLLAIVVYCTTPASKRTAKDFHEPKR